jgi:hypothetical protein
MDLGQPVIDCDIHATVPSMARSDRHPPEHTVLAETRNVAVRLTKVRLQQRIRRGWTPE